MGSCEFRFISQHDKENIVETGSPNFIVYFYEHWVLFLSKVINMH